MTCDECGEILLDANEVANGDRSMLTVSPAVLAHVEECPACATKMREAARLQVALEKLRDSTMHSQVPASLDRNLLHAFRQEVSRRRSVSKRAPAWRLAWLTAATVMLIVAGIALYSRLQTHSVVKVETKESGGEEVIETPSARGVSHPATQALQENYRSDQNAATKSRLRVAKAAKTSSDAIADRPPFAPDAELSMNGGGSIVRVTLPISSLVAMGVPVRPDISDNQVTADVSLDPFGAVVGIRLVPTKTSAD